MDQLISHPEILSGEIPHVEKVLSKFEPLHECILVESNLLEFGTVLELLLECRLPEDSAEAEQEDYSRIHVLRFINVQEIRYQTPVFDDFSAPEKQWKLGELSHIQLRNDPHYLVRFGPLAILFNHIEIGWENKRSMDVVFSGIELV